MPYVSEMIYSDLHEKKFSFDDQMVHSVHSTSYRHTNIIHLAAYLGQPLTTGSWSRKIDFECHAKTEIMNLETGEWIVDSDYPFSSM